MQDARVDEPAHVTQAGHVDNPTRLFRVETPHDAACATLVVEALSPGRNYLAVSRDRFDGLPPGPDDGLDAVAAIGSWAGRVDISKPPVNRWILVSQASRRAWHAAVQESRHRFRGQIGAVCGSDAAGFPLVDELYVNCMHHADVRILCDVLQQAHNFYFPHSFIGANAGERAWYLPYLASRRSGMSMRERAARLFWGRNRVVPPFVVMDGVFTFGSELPTAGRNVMVDQLLVPQNLEGLFDRLPVGVQRYYRDIGERAQNGVLLLLDTSDKAAQAVRIKAERELCSLAARVMTTEGGGTCVIKPHPRNAPEWVAGLIPRLRETLTGADICVIDRHTAIPVELVAGRLKPRATAAMTSTALISLKRIYGTRAYCAERASLSLAPRDSEILRATKAWISEHREEYIAI